MQDIYEDFWNEFEIFCKAHSFNIDTYGFGIVSHPLFNNNAYKTDDDQLKLITHSNFEEVVNLFLKRYRQIFDDNDGEKKFTSILIMINKPYRIEIFTMMQHLLSEKSYNELLNWVWTSTEFPHQISLRRLNGLFKRINHSYFMNDEELEIYNNLPDNVEIYRGIQGPKAKVKALSWTLSLDKAKWFAKRFDYNGKVFKTKISKKDIYAYCNGMGEEEIIIKPFKLKNFEEVEL